MLSKLRSPIKKVIEGDGKDVVIIGSGMGGLACGIMLAKEGFNVTILEKNRQFGGNLQIFVRDKSIFDTGVHYIGGLGKGQNLYKFFKYFEIMDDLDLLKCDEDGYDKITFAGDPNEYWHAQGFENHIKQLVKSFPEEEAGIRKYVNKIREIVDEFPVYNLIVSEANVITSDALEINTRDFIASCTKNEKLRNVLAGTNALYAGIADETPLYVHALIIYSYMESAYKCVDGGSQIERLLVKKIREYGGKVLKYKDVKRIVCDDNGVAKFVETAEGERFNADIFISNADLVKTIEMVENSKIRPAYLHRLKNLRSTVSAFIVNVVLKEDSFPYQNYNHYHHLMDDVWEGIDYHKYKWPTGFAVFTPPNSKNPEYGDCVTLFAFMDYNDVKEWEGTFHTIPNHVNDRGEGYQEFKKRHEDILLDEVEKVYPGFKDKIVSVHSSTPLTYRDYIGTEDGSLYGIAKDHKDPIKTFITPKTKVPNLFLTGANLNMHGIVGVSISALVTCGHIVDAGQLIDRINEAQ